MALSLFTRRIRPSLKPPSIKVSSVHGALNEPLIGYSASILLQFLPECCGRCQTTTRTRTRRCMYPGPGQREKYPANVPRGWEWWKQRLTHTNRDHQIRNVGGVERVDSEGHKVPPNESLHIQTKLSSSSFVPLVLSRSDPFAAIIKKSGVLGFYFAPHWCLSSLCILCSCEQVLRVNKQTSRQRQGERPPIHPFFCLQ